MEKTKKNNSDKHAKMKLILINGVPERVIMQISENNNYMSKITKSLKVTHSHVVKIIHILENEKIITKTKEGRKYKIKLTNKGKEIQYYLKSIRELIWNLGNSSMN